MNLSFKLGDSIFEGPPRFYNYSENLFAKKEFTKFFSKDMKDNPKYFKVSDDFVIYEANIQTKVIANDVN